MSQQAQERLHEVEALGGEEVIQEAMALAQAAQKAENMFSTVSDSPVNKSVAESASRLQKSMSADVSQSSTGLDVASAAGDNALLPFEVRPEIHMVTNLSLTDSATEKLQSLNRRTNPDGSYADDLLVPHPKNDLQEAKEQILSGIHHEEETNKRDLSIAMDKVEHGAEVVAGDLEKGVADTKENLYEGKENLKSKYYSVKYSVGRALDEAKQQVSSGVDGVKRDVVDAYDSVAQSLSEAKETVVDYYVEAKNQVSDGVDGVIRDVKEGIDEVFTSDDVTTTTTTTTTTTADPLVVETRIIETHYVDNTTTAPTRSRAWSIDRVGDSISETFEEIAGGIGAVGDSIGETLTSAGDTIGETLTSAGDSIGETLSHIKEEVVAVFASDDDEFETPVEDSVSLFEQKKTLEYQTPLAIEDQRVASNSTLRAQ